MDASGEQKWRVVIDYIKLNKMMLDDEHPIPSIEDIIDRLGHAQYFSTILHWGIVKFLCVLKINP